MELQPETRFGSPSLPAEAASGVLRARARSRGVKLAQADMVDLAAAAVAADAWVALTGARSLDAAAGWGRNATAAVAALLARAAGHPSPLAEAPLEDCPVSDDLLRLAEYHWEWAGLLAPGRAGDVLLRAASDLMAAGRGTLFSEYAALLHLLQESPPEIG